MVVTAIYYLVGITMAVVLKDNRAFCKYVCPVTVPLKISSRFSLPCIENCAGGGTVQFNLGDLMPNEDDVWFRDEKVGELNIFSGRPTPRHCIERDS